MNGQVAVIARGVLGIACMLGLALLLSENRRAIDKRLVAGGLVLQVLLVVAVLKVPGVREGFEVISGFFIRLMEFTREGSLFLFGGLVRDTESFGYIFAFQVLPTIVFFSAFTSALYYLNILQFLVYGIAWVMKRSMKLSGAESLAAAANIFIGQTEAPLVIKPYLARMTRSELMALMSGGMATIAGGVMVAYIGMLGDQDPEKMLFFATHLLVASIMSAPASLVMAKIMVPQTEPVDQELLVPRERLGSNLLDAIATGTEQGVRLAVNVAAMLLVFVALVALVNFLIAQGPGRIGGLNARIAAWSGGHYASLNLQVILGLLMAPLAWLMGVPAGELLTVGQLLGERIILNEFYAYARMAELKHAGALADTRAIVVTTYALCGFANVASVGIQIGGISTLAPGQRSTLAALGVRAMVAGMLACFLTACIAGMLV